MSATPCSLMFNRCRHRSPRHRLTLAMSVPRRRAKPSSSRPAAQECHVPQLGDVKNIFSDLLLHDMGSELEDTSSYGEFVAGMAPPPAKPARAPAIGRAGTATDTEWRTPPLWGLRNSAPYLHDGRAASIDEAILLHGGEALSAAQRYRQLPARDQAQLQLFLSSLKAL